MSPLLFALVLVATGCSGTPLQAADRIEMSESDQASIPVATPLATTAPLAVTAKPGPTAIALNQGKGIVVPTPGLETETAVQDESADSAPAATEQASSYADSVSPDDTTSYNGATAPGTDIPATPEPAGSETAAPEAAATATAGPETAATATPTSAPVTVSEPGSATNGAEVYTLTCARCHSEDGMGTFHSKGLIGMSSLYSQSSMVNELTNRHPVTFGFADKLSSTEINDVVAYVLATFG